jgi:hypothetical protein
MIRLIWRGWSCWRERKFERVEANAHGYIGCVALGPVAVDLWGAAA